MAEELDALSVMVDIALHNAKSVRRDSAIVVKDLAKIRDYIDENRTDLGGHNENDRDSSNT